MKFMLLILLMSSIASMKSSTGHTSRALNNDRGDRGDRRDNRRGRGDYRGASIGGPSQTHGNRNLLVDVAKHEKPLGKTWQNMAELQNMMWVLDGIGV